MAKMRTLLTCTLVAGLAAAGCGNVQPATQTAGGTSQPLQKAPRLASQRVASLAAARGATAAPQAAATSRVFVNWRAGQKAAVAAALSGAGARTHFVFDSLNAFVVTLPTAALTGLRNNPAVADIEADPKRYLDANTEAPWGVDRVQALQIWDADLDGAVDAGAPTGAGVTVCIIDSGLFTGHTDFQGVNVLGGYPSDWNQDYCGHGSHVAGTITGALNGSGVVGVSPGNVNLYLVKVFDNTCTWTRGSRLVDAINRCVSEGANVISMSLGGGGSSKNEEKAVNNAYAAGVLLVGSQGNDGAGNLVEDPPHYPSSYANVIGVAASDVNDAVAPWSVSNQQAELAAPGVGIKSTVPWSATNTVTAGGTTYQANHIEFAVTNQNASGPLADGGLCDSAGSWSGSVVLCERGSISFYDKVVNAQNGGAVAVVIYNNAAGNFYGTLGEGNTSSIPAVSVSQADGQALVALGTANADVVSEFIEQASGWETWDGTSMATPHVSGGIAVIMSAVPGASNAAIRSALQSTAYDLGPAGWDIDSGYGLVQVLKACQALGGCGSNQPQCSVDADCDDGNPCTDDTCNAGTCETTNNTASCDDGNACTTQDTCQAGACVGGSPVTCSGSDTCNPSTGVCEPPAACSMAGESCKKNPCCDGLTCYVGGGHKGPTCG